MTITNAKEYRQGYEMLAILNNPKFRAQHHYHDMLDSYIADLKRDLRKYAHRDSLVDVGLGFMVERHVFGGDYDGYTELVSIPEVFNDHSGAETFFKDFIEMPPINSMYDCTGRLFTAWYKIFKRNGKFYAYHRVCMDV